MSSIDELLNTSPAVLIENLKDLRSKRKIVEGQEALLEQLLDVIIQHGGDAVQEIARLGASVAIGPLRNQITQVLIDKRPEGLYFMIPQEVHDELVNRGNARVKLDNVRQTMARMVDSGELERPVGLPSNTVLFGLPNAYADMPPMLREQVFG